MACSAVLFVKLGPIDNRPQATSLPYNGRKRKCRFWLRRAARAGTQLNIGGAIPLGWTLASYPGVADGRDDFRGYFENRRRADA